MKLSLVSYMLHADGQIPIGLLTLAEIARQEGVHDIRITDLPERRDEDAFVRSLLDRDVVGFSSICSTFNQTIRLCGRLKAANPSIRVLLGGPQAALTARELLTAFPFVDAIFQGEAEFSWREFVRQKAAQSLTWAKIPGVAWRDAGGIVLNEPAPLVKDLDTLPLPALDLYSYPSRAAVTPIEIGRGCPFACTFCASSPFFKRRFRLKPIARILQEMDAMHERYGSRHFYFVQDSFSVKRSFVEEICAALKRHPRRYTWHCSARTDQIRDGLLATMKEAGCRGVYYGLETGSQRMQALIAKRLDIEELLKVINSTAAHALEVTTSMIIGFPNEEIADLRDTLRVFLDLKAAGHVMVQLHVLAPMPGSTLSCEGYRLGYDAMPSDFSDTAHVLDAEDDTLIRGNPEIFCNFWHYENPAIRRGRFLFIAHFLVLASIYYVGALRTAAKHSRDALIERLLTGDMPAPFHSDPRFFADPSRSLMLTRKILAEFVEVADEPLMHAQQSAVAKIATAPLRRTGVAAPEQAAALAATQERGWVADGDAREAALSFEEICASCGECRFEPGGLLCGPDEWLKICDALAARDGRRRVAKPFDSGGLLVVDEFQDVVQSEGGDGKRRMRRACPALELQDGRWRCSIEAVKPSGCIAFPLNLVLHARAPAEGPSVIALEFDDPAGRKSCPLDRALRRFPDMLQRYCEAVQRRDIDWHGAFALAAYNRVRQLRQLQAAAEGERR